MLSHLHQIWVWIPVIQCLYNKKVCKLSTVMYTNRKGEQEKVTSAKSALRRQAMEPLSVLGYSSFRCCRPGIIQTLASQGIQFFESPFVPTLLSQSSSPSSSSFLAPDYILRNVFPHPLFSTATPEMSFGESTLWEISADYSLPSRLLIFCGNGSSRKADTVSCSVL